MICKLFLKQLTELCCLRYDGMQPSPLLFRNDSDDEPSNYSVNFSPRIFQSYASSFQGFHQAFFLSFLHVFGYSRYQSVFQLEERPSNGRKVLGYSLRSRYFITDI